MTLVDGAAIRPPSEPRTRRNVTVTTLTVSDRTARTAAELKGDALVVVSVQSENGAALAAGHGLGEVAVTHLESALSTLQAKGATDEVVKLVSVPGVTAALIVVSGAGKVATKGSDLHTEAIRRAVGSATRQLSGLAKVVVQAPGDSVAEAAAAGEGAMVGGEQSHRSRAG